MKNAYRIQGIIPDWVPSGYPELEPCERAFSKIDKYVNDQAKIYNKGTGWTKKDLIKVLIEGVNSITFNDVRGWYECMFKDLYPGRPIPLYLRSDITEQKFKKEVERQLHRHEMQYNTEKVSRYGRVIKQNKK